MNTSARLKMLAIMLLLTAIIIQRDAAGFGVSPEFVGNGSGDSVYVTFVSIDTTYYSEVRNLDSLDILRYKPDGVLLDSTSEDASNVLNPTKGFYRAAFRASDGSGTMGVYTVVVRGWLAGKERGIASGVYEVIDENMDGYLGNLDAAISSRGTSNLTAADNIGINLDDVTGTLDASEIGDDAITSSKIAPDAIGSSELADGAIGWTEIASSALSSVKFQSGTFTAEKFDTTFFNAISDTLFGADTARYATAGTYGELLSELFTRDDFDSASVARSVWDNDVVAEIDRRIRYADSVGTVLNVPTSGSGAYACSLFYFEANDTTAIQGVFSRAMNNTQTATAGVGLTNSDGLVVMSLDAAMYRIWSYLTGYTFAPLPDSVSVASPSVVDTIWGTTFDPGDPVYPSLCRVYGWVRDLSGVAISGATVTASVKQSPLRYGSIIVSPYFRSTVSDSTGYWYLDLLPSANLDPVTTAYSFSIYYLTGAIAVKEVAVPDESNWELNW